MSYLLHMDKPKVTPKDFFLWVAAMIFLYSSVFALIRLLFDYINYTFPDALNSYIDPYSGSMRIEIAALIVLFPVFLLLMYFIRRDMVREPSKKELWIRRWALFLTVFIAGLTIVGDLITLINYFLGGEVTMRFVLKVLVVLLITGGGFLHFLADIWGYWVQYPKRAQAVGWGAALLVLASIAAGFFIMGFPSQIRLYRFDDQKVMDLQNVQYQIVNYWQQKQRLPVVITDLNDAISGYRIPIDPQVPNAYRYEVTGPMSFRLCATFNAETQPNSSTGRSTPMSAPMPIDASGKPIEDSWHHGAGEVCFDRTIDPQRYPPYSKQKAL